MARRLNYRKHFSTKMTPQNQPIPGSDQVPNNAGGYTYPLDDWVRLDRWLILGSEGGTYYVKEQTLTVQNAEAVLRCIRADGKRVVRQIIQISQDGRAIKNDPALFTLAMCAGLGDGPTRKAALAALPQVARIGTHLFHFLEYVEGFRGWGRGLRAAIGEWYNNMDAGRLAYQVVKYQSRDGWSHQDALRLSHPVPASNSHNTIYHWITQGWEALGEEPHPDPNVHLLWVYEQVKRADSQKAVIRLIEDHNLTWEFVPTQWLGSPHVWRALLPHLPLHALIRNLARMTASGLLSPLSPEAEIVADRLQDGQYIQRSRLHPLSILVALRTYQSGKGVRGGLKWSPVREVVDALDDAYYLSFDNVRPTGKRIMLALDVSASMTSPPIAGMPGIPPAVGSAAMAMITARTEKHYMITAFTSAGQNHMGTQHRYGMGSTGISTLDISPRMRLDDIMRRTSGLPFGGTDCALPVLYAIQNSLPIDAFVVYTDNETWTGYIHPSEALQQYRRQTGIRAKLVVVGMVSNGFSIADPHDPDSLDVVGFDTAVPQLINGFINDATAPAG